MHLMLPIITMIWAHFKPSASIIISSIIPSTISIIHIGLKIWIQLYLVTIPCPVLGAPLPKAGIAASGQLFVHPCRILHSSRGYFLSTLTSSHNAMQGFSGICVQILFRLKQRFSICWLHSTALVTTYSWPQDVPGHPSWGLLLSMWSLSFAKLFSVNFQKFKTCKPQKKKTLDDGLLALY